MELVSIAIVIVASIILLGYILLFCKDEQRKKIIIAIKKKKTWLIISAILLTPFVMYAVITMILVIIRGDCFVAYPVDVGNKQYVYYENSYYEEFTENEKINIMYDEVNKQWLEEDLYILSGPITFPYIEYWVPNLFLDNLFVSLDGKYIIVSTRGGSYFYERVAE